jgi:hypothetical protein
MSILEAMAKLTLAALVLGVGISMMVAYANSASTKVTCRALGKQVTFTAPRKGKCIWVLHYQLCYKR